ncbi:nuclear transport factor 2 family protein [Nitrospirota bacterium]
MIGAVISKVMAGKAFDHLNKGDLEAFLSTMSDDAVYHYPGSGSVLKKIEGKAAIREFMQELMGLFSAVKFDVKGIYVKNIFGMGPSNSVMMEFDVDGTLKNGSSYNNSYAIMLDIKGGKAVTAREFVYDFDAANKAWS